MNIHHEQTLASLESIDALTESMTSLCGIIYDSLHDKEQCSALAAGIEALAFKMSNLCREELRNLKGEARRLEGAQALGK